VVAGSVLRVGLCLGEATCLHTDETTAAAVAAQRNAGTRAGLATYMKPAPPVSMITLGT
jgi:hypothetical protein